MAALPVITAGVAAGVSDDGELICMARFESEDAAMQNRDRSEQGEWWAAIEPTFESVSFQDCSDVDTLMGGGSDEAGFVRPMVAPGRLRVGPRSIVVLTEPTVTQR